MKRLSEYKRALEWFRSKVAEANAQRLMLIEQVKQARLTGTRKRVARLNDKVNAGS